MIPQPRRSLLIASALGVACLLTTGMRETRAGVTLQLELAATIPSNGDTLFSYTASTAAGDEITTGSFFRIYDFNGYVSNSAVASAPNWSVTVNDSNPTPPPNVILSQPDKPNVPNITFTYTGTTPIVGATVIPGFNLTTTDPLGASTTSDFAGRVTQAGMGSFVDSTGGVTVPAAVPEPSSLVLASLGAMLFGIGRVRRRKPRHA